MKKFKLCDIIQFKELKNQSFKIKCRFSLNCDTFVNLYPVN